METLWITGAGGVAGALVAAKAAQQGRFDRICAFTHHPSGDTDASLPAITWAVLDISNREAVQATAERLPPTVIINTAAMTNVDLCEKEPEAARRANMDGPRHLAEIARASNAHLLHVSTDYVFPGDAAQPGPYRENALPRPINHYGKTKQAGDEAIAAVCAHDTPYAIVRTALVYGLGKRLNFVSWLVGELRANRRVRIVQDQFNTPTLADDLAEVLLWMASHRATGIYHAAGPDFVGRHEWALAIAQHFDLDTSFIDWVTTAELAQTAPRPLAGGLRCERLLAEERTGIPRLRGIAQGLSDIDWVSAFFST